jgi:peptidoglycan/xylan/chitin deacetylase (PgdA/CDA1 family)
MHLHQKRWAWLLTLTLGLLPACGAQDGGAAASNGQSAATTCSGYVGITFDDGPSSSTPALLNALKANGLTPVTFFNIGQNVAGNSAYVAQEASIGQVGNHSYTHSHMTSMSQSQMQSELSQTNQVISSAGGGTPKIFRPPYGESNSTLQSVASSLGLKLVTWDVDSQDWNSASTAAIVSANNQLQNGQIILMHEWPANTIAAIPQIAANLKARGLCPGVIDPSTGRAVAPSGPASYTVTVVKNGTGSGTVTSSTGGISCGSTCSGTFAGGTALTFTAAAASGSVLAGWSACSGTGSCPVTVNGNTTITVTFNLVGTSYPLTVSKSGTGSGTVTSSTGGINCGSTCSASLPSGTAVSMSASPSAGSTFAGWSGPCTGTGTCLVTMTQAQSVGAAFTASGGGPVSINVGGAAAGSFIADAYFSGGSTYTNSNTIDTSLLTGTAPPASVFQSERYGTFTYTLPGFTAGSAQTVTLYFAETYWTAAGQRSFGVSINGTSVLSAFDIYAAAGGQNKAIARTFSTTANASGQVVIQFTNGSADNAKVCGIAVAAGGTSQALTVTRSGSGSGTVTGAGLSCGATCAVSLPTGTTATLAATPDAGSTFAGWSGACNGTGACVVTMATAQSVGAAFNTSGGSYALTVARSGTGGGTVSSSVGGISCGSTCSATLPSGTVVTLTATPDAGSTFGGWSGPCNGTAACVVTMSSAQSVGAAFTANGGTTPCANPVTFTGQTSNFNTTGAVCYRTAAAVNGWGCSNFTGRTVSVNGGTAATTCGAGPLPLAKYTDGYTYFSVSAGTYSWASLYTW